jgi:hypothetical protein
MKTSQKILTKNVESREDVFKEYLQLVEDESQWKQAIQEFFGTFKTFKKSLIA